MVRYNTLFTLVFLLFSAGCRNAGNYSASEEPAVNIITERAGFSETAEEIKLSGNIEGFKTVRLGFMVAGKVSYISANEGEYIRKGSLISYLDPASYEIAKELADIQFNQVQDEYNRLKLMYDNNSLSESDFQKITFGLQQARAQQKLHTRNLEETRLYSPIEGVLLKKLCETGEIIGTGMPLFVVSDIRKVKISAFIPGEELHKAGTGQKAVIEVASVNKTFEGVIAEVGSAADPSSRSFSLKIEAENPGMLMRPGMTASVRIESPEAGRAITLPPQAVLHDASKQSYVYFVDTLSGKAFRRNVGTGRIIRDKIEITYGLSGNEIIVTGGQHRLTEGSSVTISK
ncbi:MAG TPA: efflux RND transporter periplasmic adaptor subunit [Bacteroidales bacterium]|nr:efflux RND transporter periplasmic adaptor subunit [Bacteroidales bacterium]HQH22793.1 efflux RND transporter periplasmic adaptor subunit [Bacteroidales bacterium]HQJ81741.1 efflux RND transporter periplasmic adaptor subunit [Bacteroidales bacterium]